MIQRGILPFNVSRQMIFTDSTSWLVKQTRRCTINSFSFVNNPPPQHPPLTILTWVRFFSNSIIDGGKNPKPGSPTLFCWPYSMLSLVEHFKWILFSKTKLKVFIIEPGSAACVVLLRRRWQRPSQQKHQEHHSFPGDKRLSQDWQSGSHVQNSSQDSYERTFSFLCANVTAVRRVLIEIVFTIHFTESWNVSRWESMKRQYLRPPLSSFLLYECRY